MHDKIELLANQEIDELNLSESALSDVYSKLYNSLGVEPGLLNKTSIGKNINQIYKNVDIALATIQKLSVETKESEKSIDKHVITNMSPLHGHDIVATPEIKDTLSQIIREFQNQEHLTTDDVIREISDYLEHYAPNYYIKKFLN